MSATRFFKVAALPSNHAFVMNISSNDDVTPLDGVEFNLLNVLARCMNFRYKIIIPPDREFGRKNENGEWTGIIGMTKRGEADFGLNMIALNWIRREAVDFAYPYNVDGSTFVTEKPTLLPKMLAFFYPFDKFLWACMVAVLLMAPFAFKYVHLRKYSLSRLFLEIFGSFFQQPLILKPIKSSQVILYSAWFFYARFATLCYSVLLLSFLTVPLVSRGIYTVSQVAEAAAKGTHKCYLFGGTSDQDAFYNAEDGPLHIIAETIKKYNRVVKHGGDIKEYIHDSKTILIGSNTLVPFNYMVGVYRNYYISNEMFYITLFGIPVKKNFCCLEQMNKCIFRMSAGGLYQKFLKDAYFLLHSQSLRNQEPEEKANVLGFFDMCGAFFILLGGHVAAAICFCFEIRCSKELHKTKPEGRVKRKNSMGPHNDKIKTNKRIYF